MAERIGTLGSTKIRLASWVPRSDRYQRRYLPVDPQSESLSGDVVGLISDAKFRPWVVREWSGGEGFIVWDKKNKGFRRGEGVIPVENGDGLELAHEGGITQLHAGGNLSGPLILGVAQGLLWALYANNAYPWDPTDEDWDAAVSTGASSSNQATSIADGQDTYVYSGHEDFTIRRWKSGTSQTHCNAGTGFTWPPYVIAFGTRIFALDGDQLYEVDKSTANTITQVAQVDGDSDYWLARGPTWNRAATSDVGIVWLQRLDNGETLIWEYNVAENTQELLGKLPVSWVWPYSIYFAFGFVFVTYRLTVEHIQSGDPYIYYQRGAQRGIIGPIRTLSSSASGAPTIAGTLGRKVIIANEDLWAYDTASGGIIKWADETFPGGYLEAHALVFGRDVFTATDYVRRTIAANYVAQGYVYLGWHDWDYPALQKTLLDVTVITDPLPAGCIVSAEVAVDGDDTQWFTLTGTHDVDGATRYTFPVANPTTAPIQGVRFEIRLVLQSISDGTLTPTIREVSGRATGASHVLEVVMAIDAGDVEGQVDHAIIDELNAMAVSSAIQTFSDPFQNPERATADSYNVTVAEVITPTVEDPSDDKDHPYATVRLRGVSLV